MSQLGKRARGAAADGSRNPNGPNGVASHDDANRQNKRPRKGGNVVPVRHQKATSRPLASTEISQAPMSTLKLPANLDVEYSLTNHAKEIQALHDAIRASAGGSSVRAWQMLPRHERRRNASHNLLALPKRLRQKGRAEMRASNTMPQSRSHVRKKRGIKRGGHGMGAKRMYKGQLMQPRASIGAYPRRREGKRRSLLVARAMLAALRGKAWLETHLWHAKRFRMSGREGKMIAHERTDVLDRWGFTLPEESTMKSFRASWRDRQKHVTLMDKSYESWFRINMARQAPASAVAVARKVMEEVLRVAGLPDVDLSKRFILTTLCAPATYSALDADASGQLKMAKTKCPVHVYCFESKDSSPEVLLRTHPASASQVERALRRAMAITSARDKGRLDLLRLHRLNSVPHPLLSAGSGAIGRRHGTASTARKDEHETRALNAFDQGTQARLQRSEAYNSFEISGPSAGSLLARVLRPLKGHADLGLMGALRVGHLQVGETIFLRVHDPRLSFPPRRIHDTANKATPAQKKKRRRQLQSRSLHVNSTGFACELFADGARAPTYTKGEIDSRRARLPTPGARLLPSSRDDTVPIVIACEGSAIHPQGSQTLTLLVPRAWGRAFWLSLVHSGTRVIGQVQEHALRFDQGLPTFPQDWVGTSAFLRCQEQETARAFAAWKRTPPAKRVNPTTSGVRWPFGGEGLWIEAIGNGRLIASSSKDHDGKGDLSVVNDGKAALPWLYGKNSPPLKDLVAQYTLSRSGSQSTSASTPAVLKMCSDALVLVQVTACRRGHFDKWDEIHFLHDKEASTWRHALLAVQSDKFARDKVQHLEQAGLGHKKGTAKKDKHISNTHIGSVTTGNFSLSRGKGTAIAAISLMAYIALVARDEAQTADGQQPAPRGSSDPLKPSRNPISTQCLVVVRSVHDGGSVRAASLAPASLLR